MIAFKTFLDLVVSRDCAARLAAALTLPLTLAMRTYSTASSGRLSRGEKAFVVSGVGYEYGYGAQ